MLIWHIDESQMGNTNKADKLVDLEEADGLLDMDSNADRGKLHMSTTRRTSIQHSFLIIQGVVGLLLVFLIIVVQMSDVLQYVFGKTMGRHKIAPDVSPNKTVEGSLAGLLAAMGGTLLVGTWLVMERYS